jgi:hypothetical protein
MPIDNGVVSMLFSSFFAARCSSGEHAIDSRTSAAVAFSQVR